MVGRRQIAAAAAAAASFACRLWTRAFASAADPTDSLHCDFCSFDLPVGFKSPIEAAQIAGSSLELAGVSGGAKSDTIDGAEEELLLAADIQSAAR